MENNKKSKTLVFIPAYNCEKQISRVISHFDEIASRWIDTVLVINNRSVDNTEKVAIDCILNMKGIDFKILRNHRNYGLGGSHKVAFAYAIENNFDNVAVLHGDDQGDIHDLVLNLGEFIESGDDCLLGARFHPESRLRGDSFIRTVGNKVFNRFFSVILGREIFDLGAGLNCYKTSVLKNRL